MTSTSWFQPYRRKLAPMAKIGRGFQLLVYRVISDKFWCLTSETTPCDSSLFPAFAEKKNSLNSEEIGKRKKEGVKMKRFEN